MLIEVRGKRKTWCFSFYGDPKYLADWRADGLTVNVIENTIPMNAPIPVRWWCFLQDLVNFRNPWRKS